MLVYAQEFGSIVKESLKRTKWAADYFTSAKSHYPIPDVEAQFKDLPIMALLPVGHCQPEDVVTMKGCVAPFRPVRQRTVRQEITKDKAGILAIAFYLNEECTNMMAEEIILDDMYLKMKQMSQMYHLKMMIVMMILAVIVLMNQMNMTHTLENLMMNLTLTKSRIR